MFEWLILWKNTKIKNIQNNIKKNPDHEAYSTL